MIDEYDARGYNKHLIITLKINADQDFLNTEEVHQLINDLEDIVDDLKERLNKL